MKRRRRIVYALRGLFVGTLCVPSGHSQELVSRPLAMKPSRCAGTGRDAERPGLVPTRSLGTSRLLRKSPPARKMVM